MKHLLLIAFLSFTVSSITVAQKKQITYDQAFAMKATNISKPLPQINGWLDDEHFLETRKDADGKSKTFSVSVKSGEAVAVENKPPVTAPKIGAIAGAKNITASPDNNFAAFTRDNNLFIMDLATKKESQLTTDGSASIKNGWASWVYFEEILGRASRYKAFWWSPDSKSICYMRFDDSQVPFFPIYVIKEQHGYLENEQYPKAGDKNPEVKIGVVNIETQKTQWADFNEKDDQYFATPIWSPENKLWISWMNRGQDHLTVYDIDLTSGKKKIIYDEQQSTWIDLDQDDRVEFLPSGKNFILKSDKSGWAQFYLHDLNGKEISRITNGEFTVGSIFKIDEKEKLIYFNARKENSARWDLYSASFDGKKLNRLSFGDYTFTDINLSPNNKYFIVAYSNLQTPTTLVLMDMNGKQIRELGNAKGEEFSNYDLPKKELTRVKSADSLFDLPVQITYPANFDPTKKYPVLVSIYGGPNAGTVYDSWRTSAQELWWAREGIIQVAFDNRSSGHFGKKGMNFIHRQLGKYEIEDYIQSAKFLKEKSFVDGNRIAITGGSFGGYMTCMALTYGADVFTHGIANSSVTDWHFYDTHYTERFMDTPKENPEGYKITSVMNYADKLKGNLRIIHGTSDDNVHMQNSLELINKLQDLKKHFEFMIYPSERHGIGGAKGLHNRTEAYNFYYNNLLQKPMPEIFWQKTPPPQRAF